MKMTATAHTTWRKGRAPRYWLETTVRPRASTSTGGRPVQNFDQRKARMDTGDERTIQNAGPSAETAGNTKRTATAESTKPASSRFKNAYRLRMTKPM